ncbi:hypothetical protein [Neobacillus sp. SAB-20_R2A]
MHHFIPPILILYKESQDLLFLGENIETWGNTGDAWGRFLCIKKGENET